MISDPNNAVHHEPTEAEPFHSAPIAIPIDVATPTVMAPMGPVEESSRLTILDALRGFALFGILAVNITYFAFPISEADDLRPWMLSGANSVARLFVELFCDFKFITLFSLLFGMGLALQSQRANRSGRSFAGLYSRRLLILLGMGLVHGLFIWYGDILTLYALVGFAALLFRNFSNRSLLIIAAVLFVIPLLGMTGCALIAPNENLSGRWEDIADEIEKKDPPLQEASGGPDDISELRRLMRLLDNERRVYQSGTYAEQTLHRAICFSFMMLKTNLLITSWRTLSLFLLGIVLIRTGVFDGSQKHRRLLKVCIALGLLIGLPLEITGLYLLSHSPQRLANVVFHFDFLYVGSICLAFAYAGLIALIHQTDRGRRLLSPLANAGRMALSNYLGQSLTCVALFYSFGFGLFGKMQPYQIVLIAFANYAAQLFISTLWLRRFHFGPMEWLWRTLTYGKRQPMLRAKHVAQSDQAPTSSGVG